MTVDLAEELEALAKGATPGLWTRQDTAADNATLIRSSDGQAFIHCQSYSFRSGPDSRERRANAALIVALRNNLPAILKALRREGELEALVSDADGAMADAMILIAHPDEHKWKPARERFRAFRERARQALKGEAS